MKKLLLTTGFAAAFSIAAMAQQDTVGTQTDQYRTTRDQQNTQQTDTAINQEETRTEDYNRTNTQDTRQNDNRFRNESQQNTNQTEQNQQDPTQQDTTQQQNNNPLNESAQQQDSGGETAAVDVLESKEGPNNEVVYAYQGETFYVDREKKKLVKADESSLKDVEDARNKPVIKGGQDENQ